jgi:two-component system response regulator FixJ
MKALEPIIYIIDDDAAIRESLGLLMESEGFQAQCFASARDFLSCAANAEYGCVITDIRMPDMSGIELLAALKATGATLPVLAITAYADVALAVQAMKSGAADFIEKPYADEELLAAVRAALAGVGESSTPQVERREYLERFAQLTGRESEVLAGLLEGKLNKIIAHEIGVSVRTVESVRANIMVKTGVSSLSELIRLSLLAGVR